METDKDHIHYMIETEPTMSISKAVDLIKSYTTYHIWKKHTEYLKNHFWKEHTFWTDGYFACSVGNVSEEMLKQIYLLLLAIHKLFSALCCNNYYNLFY